MKKTLIVAAVAAALSLGGDGRTRQRRPPEHYLAGCASILNPFLSGGTKDVHSSSLIIEPLARYDETGKMVPWLVDELPTVENGGVSKDLASITWTLTKGIKVV